MLGFACVCFGHVPKEKGERYVKVSSASPGRPKNTRTSDIDRDKLRAMLRRMGDEYIFYMLDEAIDALPPTKLAKIVGKYIRLEQLRPDDGSPAAKRSLRDDVKAFDAAARRGEYYVSFFVNSKNCTETSSGTRAFIAECHRHLDRCVAEAAKSDPAEIREAFEIIVALLRYIDECHDDVVFFADEGGSWQVSVDWKKIFPAWFRCVARTAEPDEFARVIVEAVDEFEHFGREGHLSAARRLATPEQRRALDVAAQSGRQR